VNGPTGGVSPVVSSLFTDAVAVRADWWGGEEGSTSPTLELGRGREGSLPPPQPHPFKALRKRICTKCGVTAKTPEGSRVGRFEPQLKL
jgi:hypothetical protein